MIREATATPQPEIHEYHKEQFLISTDPARLDVNSIHAFLSQSYWETKAIPKEIVARSIRGSLCFGVYEGQQQVGFARAITFRPIFACLRVDSILQNSRGKGLG